MKFRNILGGNEKENVENIKSDFVTLASHQLRTPLSGIKWYTEILLSEKHDSLTDRQKKYLKEVYRSNERAISLVNDLLDVSRIQEGHIHLELRAVRIEKVIQEIIDSFESIIQANKVDVNFEVKHGPLPPVTTDSEKLRRVIINLLSNSVKYTPSGGEINIVLEQKDDELQISIRDTGVGIPEEEKEKIFEKFFRGQQVIKIAPDGTGLGLYIAKSLIQAMGGEISFDSKVGEGTTFTINLPLER